MTNKSGPEHHHFTFLAVPETIIFKISLISSRSSPPTAGSARTQSVRQRPGLAAGQSASQTRHGSSGDPHFHAQNGSSSFRSPAFSSSTGARTRAHFSLCCGTYMYLPKFGVSTPPPPPGKTNHIPVGYDYIIIGPVWCIFHSYHNTFISP